MRATGTGFSRDRVVAYALLCLVVGAIVLAHYPGRLDWDSIATIQQVRSGWLGDHYTPVLAWMWHLAYSLFGLGPGVVLAFRVAGLAVGLYLVLRSAYRRVGAAVACAAILLAPSAFGFVGLVGRSSWFAAAVVLAGGLTVSAQRWRGWPRKAAIAAGFAAGVIAIAASQSAVTAVLPMFIVLAGSTLSLVHARKLVDGHRRRQAAALGLGLTAAALGLVGTLVLGAAVRDARLQPQIWTQLYDLGHMSLVEGERFIPRLPRAAQPVQAVEEIGVRWREDTSLYMRLDPDVPLEEQSSFRSYTDREAALLNDAWLESIVSHPAVYLGGRVGLWKRQIGVRGDPNYAMSLRTAPNDLGYDDPAFPQLSSLAADYSNAFAGYPDTLAGGPLHEVWVYLLACLGGLALALPRFPPPVRAVAALAAAAVGLQVSLFLMAPSVQLRYQLLTIYAGLVVAAVVVRLALGRRLGDRPPAG